MRRLFWILFLAVCYLASQPTVAFANDSDPFADRPVSDSDLAAMYQGQQFQREQDQRSDELRKFEEQRSEDERVRSLEDRIQKLECEQAKKDGQFKVQCL